MRYREAIPKYIRPPYPPTIVYQEPYCGICVEDLHNDGDQWECQSCGYSWPLDAVDESQGEYLHMESDRTRQPVAVEDIFDIPNARHPDRRRKFLIAHNKP